MTRATTAPFTFQGRDAALAGAMAFQKMRATADRTATGNPYLGHAEGDIEGRVQAQPWPARPRHASCSARFWRCRESGPRSSSGRGGRPTAGMSPSLHRPTRSGIGRSTPRTASPRDVVAAALDVVRRFPANGDPDREGAMGIYGWVGGKVADTAPGATAYVHRTAKVLVEMSAGWATPQVHTSASDGNVCIIEALHAGNALMKNP